MLRHSTAALHCVALLVLPLVAWGQAEFAPPGANLARQRPYTMEPPPNYSDCLDPGDRTQLTDGVYSQGYFWVQPSTVGWVRTRLVAITFDLGEVKAIAGASYSTAAGVADVHWPRSILVLASDDQREWTILGDLVRLSNQRDEPPPTPYRLHRFATGELHGRGRFVALVVDCEPYTVVDEIELYEGPSAWLAEPTRGRQTPLSPLAYHRSRQVIDSIQRRLRTDLARAVGELETARLNPTDRAALDARAEGLADEIDAWEIVPDDFTTILPLNELHTRIYALHAPLLRARGYRGLTVWGGDRYDPLQPLDAPATPPSEPPVLQVRMMRHEHRAEVLNLTNPTDQALTATVTATGLGAAAGGLALREVLFTDTRDGTPVAAALAPGPAGAQGLRLSVPAGTTRQVWLAFRSHDLPAGVARGALEITAPHQPEKLTVPLSLSVAEVVMPDEFSLAIGGWDETNNQGGYQVTAENMLPLIANLRDHGVNMPWSNPRVMPTPGQYDAAGNLTAPPDFTAWDEWVGRWPDVRCYGLFPSVKDSFAGEAMGTPRFDRMVGAWATAWVEHAAAQGIKPSQIMILLVDEPHAEAQDQIIIAWAKALHAAQPELVIWNDPTHKDPAKAAPEFYAESGVLCPNTTLFLRAEQSYRDFYLAQQQAGRELWFYACAGPSKLLDPASYYRGQFWLNLLHGGRGSCYWAFGDEAGNSWNAYLQHRPCYSPLFLSATTVTDAKQMEAIREGAEDFEYFRLLRTRVTELRSRGIASDLVRKAEELLTTGPAQVVALMGGERQRWATPKDRGLPDRLRLQALELLVALSRP